MFYINRNIHHVVSLLFGYRCIGCQYYFVQERYNVINLINYRPRSASLKVSIPHQDKYILRQYFQFTKESKIAQYTIRAHQRPISDYTVRYQLTTNYIVQQHEISMSKHRHCTYSSSPLIDIEFNHKIDIEFNHKT